MSQRNRELQSISASINSLSELFRDLSILVIDQGTILDSVEYNIENTTVTMEEATQELLTASRLVRTDYHPDLSINLYKLDTRKVTEGGNVSSCLCFQFLALFWFYSSSHGSSGQPIKVITSQCLCICPCSEKTCNLLRMIQ
jgi:hypothetical protein